MQTRNIVPLLIGGKDVVLPSDGNDTLFVPNPDVAGSKQWRAQGATQDLCVEAIKSCVGAFEGWKRTSPSERRRLFNRLAQLLRERSKELATLIEEELCCSPAWTAINVEETIAMAEQIAAITTSGVLSGVVPEVRAPDAHAVVFKEPLGVILGIAPWNSPAILGLRAVAAPVAAGNCAILKGSELSPRTHYFIARLFRDSCFPHGVVNFLVHRPEDAQTVFETLISHPAIRKCNFTGSTPVGRHIATRAAQFLKPVLLELGGKNFVIVLDDANLSSAADMILEGALLNTGQICMSTDIVLVSTKTRPLLCQTLREKIETASSTFVTRVVNSKSNVRIRALLEDAAAKGASIFPPLVPPGSVRPENATLIEGLTNDMEFWRQESFGPVVGVATYADIDEAINTVNDSEYGLSAAVFTQSSLEAMELARRLDVGAVHVNGPTVHDEATLPHGGFKSSGWGRFGGHWAFDEFTHTKTIIVNAHRPEAVQ
ncbi:putative Aldehyde dehydrogenase [Pleurostoma richardsiae]|uniref:Aldehyde dehydrogenase n=1 Tax=Pleurostoma richardsiae TaxID=41990 RepID=A0AA38VPS1_9PEZI|nr:putative Aldehyde dehydrogenase [Pleurostoma richardsiae]